MADRVIKTTKKIRIDEYAYQRRQGRYYHARPLGQEQRIQSHRGRIQETLKTNQEHKSAHLIKSDMLQVRAFYALYFSLCDMQPLERFATAICVTSDDKMLKADNNLIKQWHREYGKIKGNDNETTYDHN